MAKFQIVAGLDFQSIIVVKQPQSNTPLDLTGSTGVFTMSTYDVNPCIVIDAKPMTIEDTINGKFKMTLTALETSALYSDVGFAEDGHPTIPTYRAYIDITSPEYGKIYANIPEIYVITGGTACPTT